MLFFFWTLASLLLFAPGLKTAPRLMLLAAALYGLTDLAVMSPIWWTTQGSLQYNWLGKLLVILLSLGLVYGLRWVSPRESGLRRPQADS